MSRTAITAVHARRVWDSRGRPTVEAEVTLAGGARGRAIRTVVAQLLKFRRHEILNNREVLYAG